MTVVGFVVVEELVMVWVRWMKDVSKMDVVVSTVEVTKTVTSLVMKTVTSSVAVAVMIWGPFGMRGARVMVGRTRAAMVVCGRGFVGWDDWRLLDREVKWCYGY